ncbi:AfsR/SARP family transcriptional regulator [Allorhizocola rhizosphaerae]|uniref:AfsR/SARP family transcriptional regulator n=1 Tax=Allorhizocola rhizosphaerae TaxID=1872709 RepID=UPI000E3BBC04|nr:AfsR/SARP family transcriptional regulator [Allorhizocola rhizosphaerae]
MDIKVLGPLEAQVNGRSIAPSAAKPRQILALLALHVGRIVTVPALIEELWGMNPPRSALTTLQTYIMQLRRRIETALAATEQGGAKDLLVTRYGGYMLDVAPDDVDACRYERVVAGGAQALEDNDNETASKLLRTALEMWRGQALVDVQIGMRLGIEVTRLEESRLAVLESRIDADLRLGRHNTLLSELAVLAAKYPIHENLCAQYMVALYRSGRQWRALEVFKHLRQTLVDELGVEPSARLQHLQRAILASDPALDESMFLRQSELLIH